MTSNQKNSTNRSKICYPSENDIKRRIISALLELYGYDYELFDAEVNERSITHKLAEYLQRQFPYWHVDCEYNRRENRIKEIEGKRLFPDIIVHKRRLSDNLLVIEVKKGGDRYEGDMNKLRGFIKIPEYHYLYGAFLALGANGCIKATLIRNDFKELDWTNEIQSALRELGYGS
jgi:hypothetical protein